MKINYYNRQNKGITLIALVVTIIVLLILAGVAISMLTGDNSILRRAQSTQAYNIIGAAKDEVNLAYSSAYAEFLRLSYEPNSTIKTLSELFSAEIAKVNVNIQKRDTNTGKTTVVFDAGEKKVTITYNDLQSLKKYTTYAIFNDATTFESLSAWSAITEEPSSGETTGGTTQGQGDTPQNPQEPEQPQVSYAGLSSTDGDAALPTGVTEVALANVANENLKDTNKIKAVIKGTGTNNNDEVPIPVGAKYVEGTENTGVVIEYKGSEFVWVPVPVVLKTSNMPAGATPMAKESTVTGYVSTTQDVTNYEGVLYDYYSGSGSSRVYFDTPVEKTTYGQHATTKSQYREPDIVTSWDVESQNYLKNIGYVKNDKSDPNAFLADLIKDYREMVESVIKYGGFYVGRYETSLDSETIVASKKSTVSTGTGAIMPMSAASDGNQMWYGMYYKQKNFSTTGLQSSMIWGSQYDAMLNWMLTGSDDAKTRVRAGTYGNHGGSAVGCGTYNKSNVYDVINNIYDLEGNVSEWTLEAGGTNTRVYRGGNYSRADTPSSRYNGTPYNAFAYYGSRLSLYIK